MRKVLSTVAKIPLLVLAIITLLPLIYTLTNSFMNMGEIMRYYSNLREFTPFHVIPDHFSLSGYYGVLVRHPYFLTSFWNTLLLVIPIVVGQVFVSALAGYSFTYFNYRLRNLLFFLVIILMMMPYQVTLVSNYIVLDRLQLIGGYSSVIIPGIFSAFGVFLLRMIIENIPKEIVDAARIDGASHFKILWRIVIPNCRAGVVSLIVLSFIDSWNMVEQPLVFLKDSSMYPLSIYLTETSQHNFTLGFAGGMIAMIPVLLLFFFFEDELVAGISATNLK